MLTASPLSRSGEKAIDHWSAILKICQTSAQLALSKTQLLCELVHHKEMSSCPTTGCIESGLLLAALSVFRSSTEILKKHLLGA